MKRTDAIGTAAEASSGRSVRRRASPRLAGALGLGLLIALLAPSATRAKLRDTDKLFSYQLSYIRSDKAITILQELGYAKEQVIDLTAGSPNTLKGAFEAYDFVTNRQRPVIFNLPDSAPENFDPTKIQDDKVTTGGPQQRLLIVWDEARPGELERLLRLLHEQLDVPAKQIVIEALVIELDRDHFRDLGVAYRASKDGNQASFLEDEATGIGLPFIYQFTRPSAKTIFEFTANVRALVENGEAEVLSQPSIMVLDGRQAKIDVSDKIPYSREISSKLDATETILLDTQYEDVGIVLNLRPRASENNTEVTLKIEATVSSAGVGTARTTGALNAPPVVTRDVRTSVRIANNTPFVIGGLIRSTRDVGKSGIPYLKKIPGLGALFRRTNRSRTQKEVIVVVTPHIIVPEDRTFGVALAKDSDLFDHFGLKLFRNVHRVGSDDVFDLDFIRESEFMRELDRWVAKRARQMYDDLRASKTDPKEKAKWPPIPEGDRSTLARQLRTIQEQEPEALRVLRENAILEALKRFAPASLGQLNTIGAIKDVQTRRKRLEQLAESIADAQPSATEREKLLKQQLEALHEAAIDLPSARPMEAFLQLLEGNTPGEDKFVKRMLLEIVEKRKFGRFVKSERILFFERLSDDPRDFLDPRKSILDPTGLQAKLADLNLDKSSCDTAELSYTPLKTSQGLPFDPPLATVSRVPLKGDELFEAHLRKLNKLGPDGWRWQNLGVLLNDCYKRSGRPTLDHLKSALVLKRILDLNPTLPLTLDGFHAGREVVFPTRADLESRRHILDREAAALFYETLDYYFAFEQGIRRVLLAPELLGFRARNGQPGSVPAGSGMAPPTAPPAALAAAGPAAAAAARLPDGDSPARVRIVVRYGPSPEPQPVAGTASIASAVRVALPPPGSPR